MINQVISVIGIFVLGYLLGALNDRGWHKILDRMDTPPKGNEGMSVWDDGYYEEEGEGCGSEEASPDDPLGILKADRDAEVDARAETWPCNDCGLPCLKGDELCGPCFEKQSRAEEWEAMHPENRCPPRE